MKIALSSTEVTQFLSTLVEAHEKAGRSEGQYQAERARRISLEDESRDLKRQVEELKGQLTKAQNTPPAFNPDWMLRSLSPIFGDVGRGQKIQAIKAVRELTGCGLKEAKDCVEGNFPVLNKVYPYG